jgi:acetyl-CoA decarbonylase/synthase complex subunit delta
LTQGDDKLQFPVINNLANEVWKSKEAKQKADEAPTLGDPERRGILMEAVGAVSYLMAGSNILIMRHPEAIRMVKAFIDLIADGGSAADVAAISKALPAAEIDLAALAPAPDLTLEEEKAKAAPAAAKAAPAEKKAAPAAAAKPAPAAPAKPAPATAAKPAPAPAVDAAKAKADAEAKAKADAEAKAKADAEAKAKADAAAKAKAEADAKAKADAAAKAKADEAAAVKAAAAKREADEDAIRQKRAAEREKRAASKVPGEETAVPTTAAKVQKSQLDMLVELLDHIHRRV